MYLHCIYALMPLLPTETAPLLRDPETEENVDGETPTQEPTWRDKANAMLKEPFTPLSKILLVLCLILLLLMAVCVPSLMLVAVANIALGIHRFICWDKAQA
jgi:hypothetical protein